MSGLDPMVTAELYEFISRINKTGVTVIMVTHDMTAALKYASHILCMTEDNWFFGSLHEFVARDAAACMKGGAVRG